MTDKYKVDKNLECIKKSFNNIILFGEVGCGKTTIINKLCGVNFPTENGPFSCTSDVQFATTPDNNFIIDFPGLNALENGVKYLKLQKSTLSGIPARIICFIIKYERRYDLILRCAVEMYKIFSEHKENICIIITFSENLNFTQKCEIQFLLKSKLQIPDKKVLFSSINTNFSELLKSLNEIRNSVSNINSIKFSERHLINTLGTDSISLEVIQEREDYINKYNKAVDLFRNEFNKADNNSLKFALYYAFRDFKDNLIDTYSEIVKKNWLIQIIQLLKL